MISATSSAGALSVPPPWTEPPTSLTTTVAPWLASSSASPRPMPWPAPVTIATLPSRIPIVLAVSLFVRSTLVDGLHRSGRVGPTTLSITHVVHRARAPCHPFTGSHHTGAGGPTPT